MADRYTAIRDEAVRPFPGAIDTLRRLKEAGIRLGLITNGGTEMQRGKIERFDLGGFFEHIQIEGELGVGKPEETELCGPFDTLGPAQCGGATQGERAVWGRPHPYRGGASITTAPSCREREST